MAGRDLFAKPTKGKDLFADEPVPEEEVDFSLAEMLSNVPGSAYQYGSDMIQGLGMLSPVSPSEGLRVPPALPAMQSLASGFAQKAVGDDAVYANPQNVQMAEAVQGFYGDRYGSMDALKKTAMQDPVGMLADVSGIATLGSGAVAGLPGKMGKVGKIAQKASTALDPANMAMGAAKQAIRPMGTRAPSTSLMERAVKIPPSVDEAKRASMIRTMLDEQIMPTPKGLDKVDDILGREGRIVDDLVSEATESGQRIPVNDLLDVNELRVMKNSPSNFTAPKDLEIMDKMVADYIRHFDDLSDMSPRQVQDFKRGLYENINFDRKRGKGSRIGEETMAEIARNAKEALEPISPQIRKSNQRMGKLLELREKLPQASNRIGNRDIIGMGTAIPIMSGAALGDNVGAVMGAVAATGMLPKNQARLALMAEKIRRAGVGKKLQGLPLEDLYTGTGKGVLSRQALANLGRLDQE